MPKALNLIGISGSRVGQTTVVTGRSTLLGSAPTCGIVMHDRLILPRHAELQVTLDRWFVMPLDPTAAVFVNGQPVTGKQRLEAGDLLTLGTVTFKMAIGDLQERQVGAAARW